MSRNNLREPGCPDIVRIVKRRDSTLGVGGCEEQACGSCLQSDNRWSAEHWKAVRLSAFGYEPDSRRAPKRP